LRDLSFVQFIVRNSLEFIDIRCSLVTTNMSRSRSIRSKNSGSARRVRSVRSSTRAAKSLISE